jgi:hypothetical protein
VHGIDRDFGGSDRELEFEEARRLHWDLQHRYPGQSIARRGTRVIASAPSYRELCERLDELREPWDGLIFEWFDPPDIVAIY